MTKSPVLKPFAAEGTLGSVTLSVARLRLVCAYETDLAKLKKDSPIAQPIPAAAWEGVEIEERSWYRAVVLPHGFRDTTVILILRAGLSSFALHEALRKSLPLGDSKPKALELDVSRLDGEDAARVLRATGNLLTLVSYESPKYGKKAEKKPGAKKETGMWDDLAVRVRARGGLASLQKVFDAGLAEGRATNLVRWLAELPGNELHPASYAAKVRELAREWKVSYSFLDQKALAKRGANAFLAVVRAVPNGDNGIVHLIYKPKGKASGRKIALVGKGLCFDTGGYNVKVGDHMYDMHRDMTGSAVALATFGLLAQSGSADEVHCYLALAENLISPTAYRPNDVVVASNGVSIEVVDTDAEGRMVLSDTLVYAAENSPDVIVDFATLTGAVVRAIDTRRSGVFSNTESLLRLAVESGERTGERVWPFPIGEDYEDGISSEIADVRQCAHGNCADHIYAATFLNRFVPAGTPWLHIDLASESHKGGLGLSAKDITGYGVRLTRDILENMKVSKAKAKKKMK